ncbi:MAG: hypothetical protein HOP96_12210 [Sphingomonas sp.]|nr:hypothetical protein [Sphingomonas sp.]
MLVRLFVLAIAAATPAAAPLAQPTQPKTAFDPNERICESIPVIGSRLAKRRICATRAEWEEQRRQDRQAVEQIQKQIGGPCSTTPSARNGASVVC